MFYYRNNIRNNRYCIDLIQCCIILYYISVEIKRHLDSVVEKRSVHCFPDGFHPSEREGQVGQTSTDAGSRQSLLHTQTQSNGDKAAQNWGESQISSTMRPCLVNSLEPLPYFDKLGSPDEVDSIVIVFLHACANGEDVGVKDDVVAVKPHLVDQQLVGSSANCHLALCICGLETAEHLSGYSVAARVAGMCVCPLACPSSSKAITTTAAP